MKVKSICLTGILTLSLLPIASLTAVAQSNGSQSTDQSTSQGPSNLPPIDKLVTATCRQAWHMGGKTQEGFFAIVQQLTELSAQNRGVTLPNDKAAGERAGQWIRTQALKDPDQLLYAIVDQAVQHSIAKGRATPTGTSAKKRGSSATAKQQ
jgi:hypothetical protein